jgi:hypothetical protein
MTANVILPGTGQPIAAVDVGAATAAAVTVTIASPAVITDTGHGFAAGQSLTLSTTGALPTGLAAATVYFVLAPTANTYTLALTNGGAAINTTGTQSGVHTRQAIIYQQVVQVGNVLPPGSAADAGSSPTAFSTEGKAQLGSLTETAPTTDTASSGLNGRLQRIAQRITSLIAAVLPSATANGLTKSRVNVTASNNLTSLKASAGQVYSIDVFNVAAYNVFLKLYNKASAPVVASDTPVFTIPIQAGGGYSKSFPAGSPFSTGIAYAVTKLQADTDATNVVAGDLTGEIEWI